MKFFLYTPNAEHAESGPTYTKGPLLFREFPVPTLGRSRGLDRAYQNKTATTLGLSWNRSRSGTKMDRIWRGFGPRICTKPEMRGPNLVCLPRHWMLVLCRVCQTNPFFRNWWGELGKVLSGPIRSHSRKRFRVRNEKQHEAMQFSLPALAWLFTYVLKASRFGFLKKRVVKHLIIFVVSSRTKV